MNSLYVRAILAGLLFGIWPLVMNRSGLSGNLSSAIFAGVAFLIMLPLAITGGFSSMQNARISFAVFAGIAGGIGVLFLNSMLAKVNRQNVGALLITMVLTQVAVTAIYHMYQGGEYSIRKILGVIAAIIAVILLG